MVLSGGAGERSVIIEGGSGSARQVV